MTGDRAHSDGRPVGSPEASRASISRIVRGLNHDLKNPLGAAGGYLDLLSDGMLGELSEEQRDTIQRVRGLTETALGIIDGIVTYARAALRELDTRILPTDIARLVRMTAADMEARAEQRGVRVEVDTPDGIPDLRTDPDRIGEIVAHLLDNAIGYSPEGGSVRVAVREAGANGERRVRVEITDSGPGIAPEEIDRLFEPFETGRAGAGEGAGFGLPLSRALADLLGGSISVENAPDGGATFTLSVPDARSDPAESPGAADR